MLAEKLIVMTTVPGVYKDFNRKDEIFSVLTVAEARARIADGTAGKGMSPKLAACAMAAERGVRETHIINGLARHSLLLETFTKTGIGTMVVKSHARGPARAAGGRPQLLRERGPGGRRARDGAARGEGGRAPARR